MSHEQSLKAQARLYAKAAPRPDPAIGRAARAEAEAAMAKLKRDLEPVYRTQVKSCGTITHRGSGRPMSEFSDPSANTVRAAMRAERAYKRA